MLKLHALVVALVVAIVYVMESHLIVWYSVSADVLYLLK